AWYQAELVRRTGLRWSDDAVAGATWQHEQIAAQLASAARAAGRPVAASPAVTAAERALLGSAWSLEGIVYRARLPRGGSVAPAAVDVARSAPWALRYVPGGPASRLVDDVAETMLGYLACPLLRDPATPTRDSLEVRCNLR
ncbi:MAG TPA: hypothetical protein VFN38_15760, partial [Gemmatimonadaceae bacterium]|nr:hypothetical protein [Gemmatimonadaceae bacterium]